MATTLNHTNPDPPPNTHNISGKESLERYESIIKLETAYGFRLLLAGLIERFNTLLYHLVKHPILATIQIIIMAVITGANAYGLIVTMYGMPIWLGIVAASLLQAFNTMVATGLFSRRFILLKPLFLLLVVGGIYLSMLLSFSTGLAVQGADKAFGAKVFQQETSELHNLMDEFNQSLKHVTTSTSKLAKYANDTADKEHKYGGTCDATSPPGEGKFNALRKAQSQAARQMMTQTSVINTQLATSLTFINALKKKDILKEDVDLIKTQRQLNTHLKKITFLARQWQKNHQAMKPWINPINMEVFVRGKSHIVEACADATISAEGQTLQLHFAQMQEKTKRIKPIELWNFKASGSLLKRAWHLSRNFFKKDASISASEAVAMGASPLLDLSNLVCAFLIFIGAAGSALPRKMSRWQANHFSDEEPGVESLGTYRATGKTLRVKQQSAYDKWFATLGLESGNIFHGYRRVSPQSREARALWRRYPNASIQDKTTYYFIHLEGRAVALLYDVFMHQPLDKKEATND